MIPQRPTSQRLPVPRHTPAWVVAILLLAAAPCRGADTPTPAQPPKTPTLPAFLSLQGHPQAPAATIPDGYVGSDSCRDCHASEHNSWHKSYHRTMTQRMDPSTVLGPFDGTEVESGGYRYRLTRKGDTFFSEGPDPDLLMYWVQGRKTNPPPNLPRVTLPVVMATGSHHYQTYWVPSPRHPGILQTLPVVYLRETRQWAPREVAFVHGPDDPERFVTQWNHHCIQCHSTGGNPGLDKRSGQLRTQVAELGISCESCHGPGQAHVDLRRSLPKGVRPDHERIINPDDLSPQRSSEVCGQCHGVFLHRDEFAFDFAEHGILFRPGEVLERTRYYPRFPQSDSPESVWADLRQNPQFFKNRWWPDGQMMAAGREFSAMRESGCHSKGGMSCRTCHSMHSSDPDDQLRRDRNSSASCLECHREDTYSTRVSLHTHHAPGSSGSDCLNCHMPHTGYALFKAIRNHQISSPTVNPVERGTPPNACNLCHLDRTLEWTQDWLTRWYNRKPAAPLVSKEPVSAVADTLLRGNASQRIIAAWHLGWDPALKTGGGPWVAPVLSTALLDDYGAVRFVAARSLQAQPGSSAARVDFLASERDRRRAIRDILSRPTGLSNVTAVPSQQSLERLQLPDGRPDLLRIQALLDSQNRSSVTISE
jgi:hypothetical protein